MREFLRAKIHGGRITKADLDYEGSLGIDAQWLKETGILPFESVEVYNVTNGHRLRTYAIELPAGSRRIESNGAAAHWMRKGDKVIVASYAWIPENQISSFRPKVLILDDENQLKGSYEHTLEASGAQTPSGVHAPSVATRVS